MILLRHGQGGASVAGGEEAVHTGVRRQEGGAGPALQPRLQALSGPHHPVHGPGEAEGAEQRLHLVQRSLGLLDRLHPDRLSPAALGDWLADDSPSPAAARDRVDFDGVARLRQLLGEVLTLDEMQKGSAHAAG